MAAICSRVIALFGANVVSLVPLIMLQESPQHEKAEADLRVFCS